MTPRRPPHSPTAPRRAIIPASKVSRTGWTSSRRWEVQAQPIEEEKIAIPAEFDRVLSEYNLLQQKHGLDLSRYKRKRATRYTYEVTNYDAWDGPVYLTLLVCRNRVIGGDICSADVNGFVLPLTERAPA